MSTFPRLYSLPQLPRKGRLILRIAAVAVKHIMLGAAGLI